MSNVLKLGLRLTVDKLLNSGKHSAKPVLNFGLLQTNYSRALWHMCSTSRIDNDFLKQKPLYECCQCGCSGLIHTSGEKELADFLKQEIAGEKQARKSNTLPSQLNGFAISANMAELIFEKKSQYETVTVSMNVNHSIGSEEVGDEVATEEEMKCKPSFEVDIVRNKKTLSFSCSFTNFDSSEREEADLFEINEVTYFEGEWEDKTYSVAADLLDENLYDLFMVVLGEKGITREFVQRLSEIATSHEHMQYIGLLENVRKFTSAS